MDIRLLLAARAAPICLGLCGLQTVTTGCAGSTTGPVPSENGQPGGGIARDVSVTELKGMLASRPDMLLLDVRTDKEWKKGLQPSV